jgi:hypothetical protein
MLLALLTLTTGGAADLNHPQFARREACERRLTRHPLGGPVAYAALLAATDPETRARAARIATPYVRAWDDLNASRWVAGPEPTDAEYQRLHRDIPARCRLASFARRYGLLTGATALDGTLEEEVNWWADGPEWELTRRDVRELRQRVAYLTRTP